MVCKNSIVFKVFSKKILKLNLHHLIFSFEILFILILLLNHHFIGKQDGEKDFDKLVGFSGFEIIFRFLIKLIVIKI